MNCDNERMLTIDSPPMLEFKFGLNACIQALLTKMKEKNSTAGEVTAKVSFELGAEQIVDDETGEVTEVYIPIIEHRIKTKISLSMAETKGVYADSNMALEASEESGWSWKDINKQETLF